MLKAVVFINLRGKICDDLGQQLASWKSDHWGNAFEELNLHREQNDPAAASWVRQPPLRPAQVGMKGRHIVPLAITSLRENTANVSLPSTYVSKHKHKNSFLCQSSATQLIPILPLATNQASIYSPALHPLHMPDWSLLCETSQHPPAWLPGISASAWWFLTDYLVLFLLPAPRRGGLFRVKTLKCVHTHWECAHSQNVHAFFTHRKLLLFPRKLLHFPFYL